MSITQAVPDVEPTDFVWRMDALRFIARYIPNPIWSDDDTAILVSFEYVGALFAVAHVYAADHFEMVPDRAEALLVIGGRDVLVVAR